MFIVAAAVLAAFFIGAAIVSPWISARLERRWARQYRETQRRRSLAADYGYQGETLERMGLDPERYTLLADRLSRTASP